MNEPLRGRRDLLGMIVLSVGGLAAPLLPPALAVLAAGGAVLGVPGWGLARLAGRSSGRRRSNPVAWGFAAFAPLVLALWWSGTWIGLARGTTLAAALAVGWAAWLGGAGSAARPRNRPGARRLALTVTGLAFALATAIPMLVHGSRIGDAVRKVGMTDWYKHLLVANGLTAASSLPPANPFHRLDTSFEYYFGFQLVGQAIGRVAGQPDRLFEILVGVVLLTAFASPFVLHEFARLLGLSERRASLVAIGGLFVGGLDLVVWVLTAIRDGIRAGFPGFDFAGLRAWVPSTNPHFWLHHDDRQFNPPYWATMWAPQHWIAALLALLALGLVLRATRDRVAFAPGQRLAAVALPALLLAPLSGISTYVALGTAIALVAAFVAQCRIEGAFLAPLSRWLPIGGASLALGAPILLLLTGGTTEHLVVAVSPSGDLANGALFTRMLGDLGIARLLDSPLILLIQFGLVGLLGLPILCRYARRTGASPLAQLAPVAPVLLLFVTIVRPPLDGPNNVYARVLLLAWGVLLPYAAIGWRRPGPVLIGLLAVSMAVVPLGVLGMTLEGYFFRASPASVMELSEWLNARWSEPRVIAVRPSDFEADFGYWLRHPLLTTEPRYAVLFGADPLRFAAVSAALEELFETASSHDAAATLDELGAEILVSRESPPWSHGSCFEPPVSVSGWWVVERVPAECRY